MIDPQPGDIFRQGQILNNTYEIEGVLGRGGTGEVYRARNLISGRVIAIKALNSQFSGREDYVELMRREEQMRDIQHDAVVRYTECSRSGDGHVFLVMDHIDGPSMQALLDRGGMDARELLIVAHRVAEGLVAAHARGVVHRDLSPDNVILRDGMPERATIIDFGIAKDTTAGARTIVGNDFAGKYEYAAPEQLEGHADGRSDLYALGALLLATYRGRLPFLGATPGEIVRRKQQPIDTEDVPDPLKGVIDWLAAPDPAARPQDARTAAARLETLLAPQRPKARAERRRGRGPWLTVPLVVAIMAAGAWYAGLFGPPPPPPLPVAAPYRLEASTAGGAPRLAGNAPDAGAARIISEAFAAAAGSPAPEGALTLAEGVPDAGWPAGVAALFPPLAGAVEWRLDVRDRSASVTGIARDGAARDEIAGRLGTAAAQAGLDIGVALRAGPVALPLAEVAESAAGLADCGPLTPAGAAAEAYTLDETVTLQGAIASEATREALVRTLAERAGDRPVRIEAQVLNAPICLVRRALPPVGPESMSIWLGQGATGESNLSGVFRPGDNPLAELHIPADRTGGYVWIAVVDTSGNVFNMLPNLSVPEHRLEAVGRVEGGLRRVRLLHSLEEFAADNTRLAMAVTDSDFGKSEIIAFLTREPLFDLRPKTESAASFARALAEAVAQDPAIVLAVATRVLDSRP